MVLKLLSEEDVNEYIQILDELIEKLESNTELQRVYDDTTPGCKDTWSDCGQCTKYNNISERCRDLDYLPCPFDPRLNRKLNNAKILSSFDWIGCYYRCMLRKGMKPEEACMKLKEAKQKILGLPGKVKIKVY